MALEKGKMPKMTIIETPNTYKIKLTDEDGEVVGADTKSKKKYDIKLVFGVAYKIWTDWARARTVVKPKKDGKHEPDTSFIAEEKE